MYETGHFAALWQKLALRLGLKSEFLGLPGVEGWRKGVQAHLIEERLKNDKEHSIKAVCVVHNETSTGATSNILAVRAPSMRPSIPRCCWSTRSRAWPRPNTSTTSGAPTSPSAARRRA
jgi:hypothetical protein